MPAMPRPVADEKSALLAFLSQQRQNLRTIAFGLTDDQARSTPTVSALSVGALIKHVTACEASWVGRIAAAPGHPKADQIPFEQAVATYADQYTMTTGDTLAGLLAELDAQEATTERIVAASELDTPVPVPRSAPWFPQDIEAWSVRWVLCHVIEEAARHSGHADIIRETLDRATWFELMAAADGMEETPWLKPWKPTNAMSSPAPPPPAAP